MTKYKIGIIIISSFIIYFIFLFKNAFYQKINFLDWKELRAVEFNGIIKPFAKYDAVISYDIVIYYDSISKRYISKSQFNDKLSWMKSSAKNSNPLLKHEQYHFNIAEYHSRLLNKRLRKINPKKEIDYSYVLDSIINENNKMQGLYDEETNHSLVYDEQKRWEKTVDSLMKTESNNQEYSHEFLNGNNYNVIWTNLSSNDSIVGKIELYASKKDTIWNQFKNNNKKGLDSLKSRFYELDVSKLEKKNSYQINIKVNHDFNDIKFADIYLEYLEQNKDSLWKTTKLLKSLDSINVNFENYYNNKFHGILRWTIPVLDTIKNIEDLHEHYLLIDNKKIISDAFIDEFELLKYKKISD